MKMDFGEIMTVMIVLLLVGILISVIILLTMYGAPLPENIPKWIVFWLPSVMIAYFFGWIKLTFKIGSNHE